MTENITLPQGAVQRALELQLFGRFTTRETTIVVGTSAGVILNNNPERIGFVMTNTGGTSITFSLKRDIVSNKGLTLAQQGDTVTTNYIEDAQYPTHELSAISDTINGELFIVEFIRVNI